MISFWIPTDIYIPFLFVLIFMVIGVIAISASDVIIQALSTTGTASGTFKYSNIVIVGVSYSILAIITVSITCNRFLKTRRMLRGIAKDRIPEYHLPKKVAVQVQHGFDFAISVLQSIKPLSSDINHPGWANPNTIAFQGVNLKFAVIRTPTIIEKAATKISGMYARPSFVGIRQYIIFLIRHGIVEKGFGLVYLEGYERARFSKYGPTEDEYMNIMRHLAAILNQMGYHLQQTTTPTTPASSFIGNPSQPTDVTISAPNSHNNQYQGILKRYGDESSQANGGNRRQQPVPFHNQYRNMNNNSAYSSNYSGHLTPRYSIPGDDNVISLAQSVATWSLSSHPNQRQHYSATDFYGDQNGDYSERLRHVIYDRLMTPHI